MLVMKAWLETRWRLTAVVVYSLIAIAVNYRSNQSPSANPRGVLSLLLMILASFVLPLGGAGVRKAVCCCGAPACRRHRRRC